MATLTVTAKGQITLRKEVLRHLGIKPGDKVSVDLSAGGGALLKAAPGKDGLDKFFGSLHRPGERIVSVEEMNQAIQDGWAGKR